MIIRYPCGVRPRIVGLLWVFLCCAQAGGAPASAAGPAAAPMPVETSAAPASRPRVGLVLSGGGARGGAHIGVLRVLEREGVIVDAIAGTSMGAVVGGLYASGLTADEIERALTSVNWRDAIDDRPSRRELTFRRKSEDLAFLVRFPLGLRGGDFKLPKGLIQGQKLNALLRNLTLPVTDVRRFDDLPTPFRAVATDLESGESVVIDSGDLATAMRASLSAPGVFTPVEREERLLVDGGLTNNFPVDIVREMGVDVVIAVDVGFPLLERSRLDSVATISNQMIAIFVRRNALAQRATLEPSDVLIEPALGDASSFDFGRLSGAVRIGEQAADGLAPRLAALAAPRSEYDAWLAHRADARRPPERIAEVRVAPSAARYEELLTGRFGSLADRPFDGQALSRRITRLYGQGNLESLDYRLEPTGTPGESDLVLDARRNSWGPNYIRFGLNLQDDFEGNSNFNAAARVVLSELTARGAESVWDFQVGASPLIATELYVPLDLEARWFVAPQARLQATTVPVFDGERTVAEFRVRSFRFGLDVGRELGEWGELRAGIRRDIGSTRLRLGQPSNTVPAALADFDAREYFGRFSLDQLDDVNFPRDGQSLTVEWRGDQERLGSNTGSELLSADLILARSWGRHTAVLWSSGGVNFSTETNDLRTRFPLGGFLNLSGIAPDSINGRNFAIVRGLYFRQIGRGGPGFLDVPTYIGASFEIGNVWDERGDLSFATARRNGSLFLGLDTLLGPVYLATGFEEGGQTALYLFLGRTF